MQAQSYPHPPVRADWLNRVDEDVLEAERPIIDPHHHLWHDRASGRYLIEDIAADLSVGHRIIATVFMQCGWQHRKDGPVASRPVGETEVNAAIARLSETGAYGTARICDGIVGFADLSNPEVKSVLDEHVAAGAGHFRGIRHSAALDPAIVPMTSVTPPPGLLLASDFHRGLRILGECGLTYDGWQYHPQLEELLVAARAAPGTPIVIDHVGGPLGCGPYRGHRDEIHRKWLKDMQALASCPNVYVKLGGLAMPINGFDYHEDELPPTSDRLVEDWRPWIEPCIEMFTPERSMFESNFPVDKGMCSYRVLWNAFKKLAAGASEQAKSALFRDTAAQFYKLSV
jgi:L-fuconolactonase